MLKWKETGRRTECERGKYKGAIFRTLSEEFMPVCYEKQANGEYVSKFEFRKCRSLAKAKKMIADNYYFKEPVIPERKKTYVDASLAEEAYWHR